ncbi:MAG: hypothetical protein KME09_16380 [Pleurocapsa minor HA4230-MV1]|jgi:hypothetical protein|nr:hypothetical protein [Pleurocapsa minor HA4230-MV1]
MGNWHCVSSSCAEVVYQQYEPPRIRWRYPGEVWKEIIGTDYLIKKQNWYGGQNPNIQYQLKYGQAITSSSGFFGWSIYYSNQSTLITPPISNVRLNIAGNLTEVLEHWAFRSIGSGNPPPDGNRNRSYSVDVVDASNEWKRWLTITSSSGLKVYGFEPANGSIEENAGSNNCTFTVYKNDTIVYQETREFCPEVEKIPCKLSDVRHSIKIEKLPFLEKVEVVPYQYSVYRAPGIPAPIVQADQIPAECLNIYNNAIYVIPPSGQGIYPNATPFDSFIAQICSYPGCPAPEYTVICDCQCQSCPDGTCPIECDDHICCYNDYGVSVAQIPQADYCGGNS